MQSKIDKHAAACKSTQAVFMPLKIPTIRQVRCSKDTPAGSAKLPVCPETTWIPEKVGDFRCYTTLSKTSIMMGNQNSAASIHSRTALFVKVLWSLG